MNNVVWEERFKEDVFYVNNISLKMDISIIFKTIMVVLSRSDIEVNAIKDFDEYRREQNETNGI